MRSPFARRFGLASPFLDNEDGFRPSQLFADGGNGILWDFTATGPLFTDSASIITKSSKSSISRDFHLGKIFPIVLE